MISSGQRQKQTAANEVQVQSRSYRPMMIYGKCCRVVLCMLRLTTHNNCFPKVLNISKAWPDSPVLAYLSLWGFGSKRKAPKVLALDIEDRTRTRSP